MQPSPLVMQGNADAEQRELGLLGQNPISSNASTNSTTDQALSALNGANTSAPTPPPAAGPHTSLLERLLPTIGGVGGGLLAGALDIGTGGLAIPLDAGIAGAGAALGKAGENALTHQSLGNGVLGQGLMGAAGQGVGEGAGLLLGKAGGALTGAGEKMASNAADKAAQASSDAEAQTSADIAKKSYAAIPKGLRQAHDLEGSLGLAKQYGLDTTNPQSLVDAGSQAKEILANSHNDALGQAGPLDASSYNDIVKNAIADKSGVLGSYDPTALSRGRLGPANTPAAKLLTQLQNYGAGVAKVNADPTEVKALLQKVGSAYGDATPGVAALTGAKDPVQIATHGALGDVYNQLKGLLYDRPEVADNFNSLPANIQAEDVGGNQALADDLNKVLGAGQGHQPVLDALQKYGNLANTGQDALTAGKGLVPDLTEAPAAAVKSSPFNTDNVVNLGSLAEGTIGHHPAALALPLLLKAAENPAAVQGVGKGVSALGESAAPGIVGSVVGNSPNDVASPTDTSNSISLGNGMNQGTTPLEAQILAALAQYGNGGAGQLGGAISAQQKANEAQAAEQNLMQNFNTAGGAQGPIGGILSRLGATFTGGEAGQYGGQAQADAQTIANATGVPLQEVEKSLPNLGENQSAAQASLGNIQSLIQALTQGNTPSGVVAGAQQ